VGTGNRQAVYWRGIGEILAFDRRDKLAADVVAITGFERNECTFGAGVGVTHAEYLLVLMLVLGCSERRAVALV
jgi:hypothetical protein